MSGLNTAVRFTKSTLIFRSSSWVLLVTAFLVSAWNRSSCNPVFASLKVDCIELPVAEEIDSYIGSSTKPGLSNSKFEVGLGPIILKLYRVSCSSVARLSTSVKNKK